MRGNNVRALSLVSAIVLAGVTPAASSAQVPRTSAPNAARPSTVEAPRGSGNPRTPFAGIWDGTRVLATGPGANEPEPYTVVFDVVDSTRLTYAGAMIFPGNAKAPHVETTVKGSEMRWKLPNSGGGVWVYVARLVSRDRIEGTLELKDWPQLPPGAPPPRGTFSLGRRAPTGRGGA